MPILIGLFGALIQELALLFTKSSPSRSKPVATKPAPKPSSAGAVGNPLEAVP
jgi:hypothetical protein